MIHVDVVNILSTWNFYLMPLLNIYFKCLLLFYFWTKEVFIVFSFIIVLNVVHAVIPWKCISPYRGCSFSYLANTNSVSALCQIECWVLASGCWFRYLCVSQFCVKCDIIPESHYFTKTVDNRESTHLYYLPIKFFFQARFKGSIQPSTGPVAVSYFWWSFSLTFAPENHSRLWECMDGERSPELQGTLVSPWPWCGPLRRGRHLWKERDDILWGRKLRLGEAVNTWRKF